MSSLYDIKDIYNYVPQVEMLPILGTRVAQLLHI